MKLSFIIQNTHMKSGMEWIGLHCKGTISIQDHGHRSKRVEVDDCDRKIIINALGKPWDWLDEICKEVGWTVWDRGNYWQPEGEAICIMEK